MHTIYKLNKCNIYKYDTKNIIIYATFYDLIECFCCKLKHYEAYFIIRAEFTTELKKYICKDCYRAINNN